MTTIAPAAVENTYAQYLAELARKQNTTPEEFRAPARVYWHRHNYAKFHFDLAPWKLGVKSIAFANFRYITDDKREQDQLDLVVNQPGTMIYSVPDSDARKVFDHELQAQLTEQVTAAARANAGAHNQIFDSNVPIQAVVNQQPTITALPLQNGGAVVGMGNSFNAVAAVDVPSNAQLTTPETQVLPPTAAAAMSAGDLLKAQLAAKMPT